MDLAQIAAMLKTIALVFSVIIISYAGFILLTKEDPSTRNEWKEIIIGVLVGLMILFIAPEIAKLLSGGSYCG